MGISTFITLMIIYNICSLCLGYNKEASTLCTSYINRKSVENEKTITSEGYGVRCCGLFY